MVRYSISELFLHKDPPKWLDFFRKAGDSEVFGAVVNQLFSWNKENLAEIKKLKIEIIAIMLDRGLYDVALTLLKIFDFTMEDLGKLDAIPERASVLWHACNSEHVELVEYVLNTYGNKPIWDNPAPDGTTALAVTFGRLNKTVLKMLLRRGRNVCYNNDLVRDFRLMHGEARELTPIIEDIFGASQSRSLAAGEARTHKKIKPSFPRMVYPHVNPHSELALGQLNRKIHHDILQLGQSRNVVKRTIKSEDYSIYILDHFCIKSQDGKWGISEKLKILKCVHVEENR